MTILSAREQAESNTLPLMLVLAIALVGDGAFVFMKFKGKKKEQEIMDFHTYMDYVRDDVPAFSSYKQMMHE